MTIDPTPPCFPGPEQAAPGPEQATRRRPRRWRAAGLAATTVLLATPGVASANGNVAMAVNVSNSSKTMSAGAGGSCTWQVTNDVVVVNLTSQPLTISDVGYRVSWTGPGGQSGVVDQVTVVASGGLTPGVVLNPDERRTFSPVVVAFAIPCSADFGDLAVSVTSSAGTGSGDAPFLSGGTPVPPAAVGLLALAVIVAGWLVVSQRRRLARV